MDDQISILENQIELLEETIFCAHLYLNGKGIPRYETEGEYKGDSFSIVGRIKMLIKKVKEEV